MDSHLLPLTAGLHDQNAVRLAWHVLLFTFTWCSPCAFVDHIVSCIVSYLSQSQFFCLTLLFLIRNLFSLVTFLLRGGGGTHPNWKPLELLWCFAANIANYLCRRHGKYLYKTLEIRCQYIVIAQYIFLKIVYVLSTLNSLRRVTHARRNLHWSRKRHALCQA